MMARPAAEPAPAPDGARAGTGMGIVLRALRSGRMPSTPRMLAAAAGLALTALAFTTGALGSSAPADAGAFFARSAASSPAAATPSFVGASPAPATGAPASPAATPAQAVVPAWPAPSAAPSSVAAAPSAAPSAVASPAPEALLGAGAVTTGKGGSTAGTGGSGASDDISLLGESGGAFDPLDLASKGAIVVALLYVTLRVLRRMQGGTPRGSGRIHVLESRPLAAKASLHLVEVGDRRLVVGLTPAGMVSLAELGAEDLPEVDSAADPASMRSGAMAGAPSQAGVGALLRGGASFAASVDGALGAVRAGLGSARSRIGSAR